MATLNRILCVDDEPDIRKVLKTSLRFTLKCDVHDVGSAQEAFDYLDSSPAPDLIILDGMMPGIDGYEACRRLRADARFATVPIVFLTAKAQKSEQDRAIQAGATACLTKPFDPLGIGKDILAAIGASE